MKIKVLFLCCLFLIGSFNTKAQNGLSPTLFKNPPSDNRVHTWWHFIDNYITNEGITNETALKGNLSNDIVTNDSPLLPSGISSPIKIYSVHTPTIEVQ